MKINRLKDIIRLKSGQFIDKSNSFGPYPILGANGIIGHTDVLNFYTPKIIIGRVGSAGAINIFKMGFASDNSFIVDSKNNNLKYIYYLLKDFDFNSIIQKSSHPLLVGTKLLNTKITFENNKNFQNKIVKFLDENCSKIDSEISLLEKKSELLEEYKQSLIFETVTKGLDKNAEMKYSGIELIGEIPKNWTVNRLKDKLNIQKGSVFTDDLIADEGIYPYINGGVKPSGWTNAFNCMEKTIAVSEGGASSGYSQYMETKFWAGSHCYKITPKKNENSKYYYYLLKGFEKEIQSAKTGSAMPNLQKSKFTNLIFSFTNNLYEQNSIVEYLDLKTKKIENEVKLINKKIELLKEYKQSLIYEAVTGQLEIE